MNKGTVLFHKRFVYTDGEVGEKLIILLNTPKDVVTDPYLFCRTTKNERFGITGMGCYSHKNIYVLNAKQDFFELKTWIQFHEIWEAKARDFLELKFKGDLEIKGCLREETINGIVKCIKRSDDVSKFQLTLL